jgi:hypothetical protein
MVLDMDFEQAMTEALQAFRAEDLEPIARTDVREQFRRTIGHDMHNLKRYVLLDVWSPRLAVDTYEHDPDGEAILPATFAIEELSDGRTAVTASEPLSWLLWDRAAQKNAQGLATFADEQDHRVAHVMERLQRSLVRLTAIGAAA